MSIKTWVIGNTSGIGAEVFELLSDEAKHPDYVVGTGVSDGDVRNMRDLREIWEGHGPFDRVVYCAGVNTLMWNHEQDFAIVKDMFDVNVFGFMRVIRLLSEQHRRDASFHASCVVVSSDAATRPMRTSMAYCASKAALNSAVKQAAREGAPWLRVNAIAPGMTAPTEMQEYIDAVVPEIRGWTPEQARAYETSQIPMGRRGGTIEIAEAIANALDGPNYMTGAIIEVNGGR